MNNNNRKKIIYTYTCGKTESHVDGLGNIEKVRSGQQSY